jgi:peptidoglycan/LPS O-acetylase OafA/YrhL
MIQRIQSVYLLLTTIFSVLFLSGNIVKFNDSSGNLINITFRGLIKISGGSNPEQLGKLLPVILLILLIGVVSLLTTFLYKNRRLQMKLTIGLLILAITLVIMIVVYSVHIMKKYDADIVPGIKMILPLLMAVCIYLAYRGIKKDDTLVRSYDRLR